ncbi:MAG: NAD(P)H-dependent oxidoreductase [Bacteroidales bacterium]|nr:NAD(P)H-dependent oxidoreductase [Bacteroidales bacterium]MCK9447587.1 NAD(P)H-dependent oxidoreductase [Bacteroidales bacterium]MDD3701496.1 NAD(P)H-dependent oxidoreductase [Bacteroidales bacterium]MDY0369223.1 NAD(P)H-dependent oxidoreductase [Bacteroidales bacterium]
MKKILIIHAHPVMDSFADQLSDAYANAAQGAGSQVQLLILRDLNFELNFSQGYRGRQELEPDLQHAQQLIDWADHLVFIYPNWWTTFPALLKGFMDRTLLPGFAFKYKNGRKYHEKLLIGKTARLVVTMDKPSWYYRWVEGAPGHKAMRKGILGFCGIKPVYISSVGPMRELDEAKRVRWLKKMETYGAKGI